VQGVSEIFLVFLRDVAIAGRGGRTPLRPGTSGLRRKAVVSEMINDYLQLAAIASPTPAGIRPPQDLTARNNSTPR